MANRLKFDMDAFASFQKEVSNLTSSLKEYEYYLDELKKIFDVNIKLNVENKSITIPAIISGILHAEGLEHACGEEVL